MTIYFRIPIGPSVNSIFTQSHMNSKRGRGLSLTYKLWRDAVGPMLTRQWVQQGKPLPTKPWGCRIVLGVNRRSDIANREKVLVDLMVKCLTGWPDDAFLDMLILERGGDPDMAEIECWSIDQTIERRVQIPTLV